MGFFHVYSVTACRIDCETRYIVENCNCRMVHMPGRLQPRRGTDSGPFTMVTLILVFQAMLLTAHLSSTKTVRSPR